MGYLYFWRCNSMVTALDLSVHSNSTLSGSPQAYCPQLKHIKLGKMSWYKMLQRPPVLRPPSLNPIPYLVTPSTCPLHRFHGTDNLMPNRLSHEEIRPLLLFFLLTIWKATVTTPMHIMRMYAALSATTSSSSQKTQYWFSFYLPFSFA